MSLEARRSRLSYLPNRLLYSCYFIQNHLSVRAFIIYQSIRNFNTGGNVHRSRMGSSSSRLVHPRVSPKMYNDLVSTRTTLVGIPLWREKDHSILPIIFLFFL